MGLAQASAGGARPGKSRSEIGDRSGDVSSGRGLISEEILQAITQAAGVVSSEPAWRRLIRQLWPGPLSSVVSAACA